MNPNLISDEDLSAWLDGALSPEDHARVETWLAAHPEDAARVRLWVADRELLRAHLNPVLNEPVPERLRERVLRGDRRSALWLQAAMAAALLVGGAAIGAAVMRGMDRDGGVRVVFGGPEPWAQRAVAAHSVYVPEPRHAVEVKAQEEHLARWLTRRIETDVKLFDLRQHGFELVGGRLLPDGRGKSAQLMYQDAQGLRVTVYLRKPEPGTAVAQFRYERQGEIGMFYWIDEDCGYALVGALPKETLLALAKSIHEQDPGDTKAHP